MGENSNIEWTKHTFNPWIGCQKVGPGCDHCYAEAWDNRSGGGHWDCKQFPLTRAGHMLDGKEHFEFPKVMR